MAHGLEHINKYTWAVLQGFCTEDGRDIPRDCPGCGEPAMDGKPFCFLGDVPAHWCRRCGTMWTRSVTNMTLYADNSADGKLSPSLSRNE